MSPRTRELLAALPARQLNLILIGLVVITAMLAWSLALRAPLAAYRLQATTLAALEASKANAPAAAPIVAAPPDSAGPATPLLAPEPLALIAAVSRSAGKAGVAVSSAAQGAQSTVAGLHTHTLDFTAGGSYAGLMAWLADIEASQPAVGVTGFELLPGATPASRQMRLQLTIYDIGSAP